MTLFQMDFFIFILVLMLVVGGVFVVFAGLGFGSDDSESSSDHSLGRPLGRGFGRGSSEGKDDNLSQKLDVLSSSVSEADEAILELSDMSKNIFREFESKYQELLFLYNLIDEKQKNLDKEPPIAHADEYTQRLDAALEDDAAVLNDNKKIEINPKFANVLELFKEGNSVEEIAKQLDMGKGEVGLILTLTGGGGI
jgi:hypothetical protein